jgi:hypothetical protein
MNTFIVISVPLLMNYREALERALNGATEQGLEVVEMVPTRFDELWLICKKPDVSPGAVVPVASACCLPWYKRLFNFLFKRQ